MKSILLSIKPEWVAKILNGEKTIEVRKLFPKDYVGWVYLYCSRSGFPLFEEENSFRDNGKGYGLYAKKINVTEKEKYGYKYLNGKVVARFWCDKVEELFWDTDTIDENLKGIHWIADEDFEKTCLTYEEYENYLEEGKSGYAIHISKLEIFDRPKELDEFYKPCYFRKYNKQEVAKTYNRSLLRAPQNYCYIDDFFFDNEETKEPESVLIDEKETDGYCR